ncbi:hypothetical protein CPB86DRAFT_813973 [Serendipita vermifera]|nr:hypothetical protein CPB86DRAFT_813973 [Serendipita vermifera]
MSSTTKPASREAKETRIRKRGGVTRPTKAPLGGMSFKLFMYILGAIALAYSIYFAYRMSELQRIKSENLQDRLRGGKRPTPQAAPTSKSTRETVQDKIEDLAAMLGIEPIDLAKAVAGVVKSRIPEESSASIVSEAKASDTILAAFTEGLTQPVDISITATATEGTTTSTGGVAASIVSAVKAAGFDDMGMDAD